MAVCVLSALCIVFVCMKAYLRDSYFECAIFNFPIDLGTEKSFNFHLAKHGQKEKKNEKIHNEKIHDGIRPCVDICVFSPEQNCVHPDVHYHLHTSQVTAEIGHDTPITAHEKLTA